MNFTEEYAKRKIAAEEYIREQLCEISDFPVKLREAAEYCLLGGGKRLRPILLTEAVKMFGGEVTKSVKRFAVAVECIHTYSLIHDDLPCMDDDDLRRGLPSCHKKFDEATAVLTGDALLNLAFELIFKSVASENDPEFIRAGEVIAGAAGGNGMIGGQICDLSQNVTGKDIYYIYGHKTGALIKAALYAGALIGKAGKSELEKIDEFGNLFGFCFQLRDDILDMQDEDPDKKTYAALFGKKTAEIEMKNRTDEAISILRTIDNSEFLLKLTEKFAEREV